MSQTPIHIIGGGLGGLTLGCCLRRQGISFILFERVTSTPRHNYAITLHPWAYRPLLQMIEMDEAVFRKRVAVDAAVGGSGRMYLDGSHRPMRAEEGSFRAYRAALESLLRKGLDGKRKHSLQKAEIQEKHINLHFENGQHLECDAAVAADGIHSQMRRSLLPTSSLKVLAYVVFNGKRRIEKDVFNDMYAPHMKDATILETRSGDCLLQISLNHYTGDRVDLSYTYSRYAREADQLHRPDRAIAGTTDIPEAFYEELEGLQNLPQPFAHMFDAEEVRNERILHWLMRTSSVSDLELQWLAMRGVVMIGDSAHGQPILGGDGGNQAIKDGVELATHIANNGTKDMVRFVEARCAGWQESVEASEKRIGEMHGGGSHPAKQQSARDAIEKPGL